MRVDTLPIRRLSRLLKFAENATPSRGKLGSPGWAFTRVRHLTRYSPSFLPNPTQFEKTEVSFDVKENTKPWSTPSCRLLSADWSCFPLRWSKPLLEWVAQGGRDRPVRTWLPYDVFDESAIISNFGEIRGSAKKNVWNLEHSRASSTLLTGPTSLRKFSKTSYKKACCPSSGAYQTAVDFRVHNRPSRYAWGLARNLPDVLDCFRFGFGCCLATVQGLIHKMV